MERTMLVFKYFCSKMDDFRKADDQSDVRVQICLAAHT